MGHVYQPHPAPPATRGRFQGEPGPPASTTWAWLCLEMGPGALPTGPTQADPGLLDIPALRPGSFSSSSAPKFGPEPRSWAMRGVQHLLPSLCRAAFTPSAHHRSMPSLGLPSRPPASAVPH